MGISASGIAPRPSPGWSGDLVKLDWIFTAASLRCFRMRSAGELLGSAMERSKNRCRSNLILGSTRPCGHDPPLVPVNKAWKESALTST